MIDHNMMARENSDQLCLKWTKHSDNIIHCFKNFYESESLVDVTLFTEGKMVKAHKMILSACSPYFETLFRRTGDKHPVVVLKDVTFPHLSALLDFMYRGEVNVANEELTAFLDTAKNLSIKGLTEHIDISRDPMTASLLKSSSRRTQHQISPQYRNNMDLIHTSSPANDHKRRIPDLYSPPSTMPSVLSKALTMPPALHLSSPLGMPHLSSLPASLATSLVNAQHHMSVGFPHPPNMPPMRPNQCESPYSKRRRKYRKPSGEVMMESGDSDGRSSGSPGDTNLHLPKIPATITPVNKPARSPHLLPPTSHSNGCHPHLPPAADEPKDLSMNKTTSPVMINQLLPTTTQIQLKDDPDTSMTNYQNHSATTKTESSHDGSDGGSSPNTEKNDLSRRSDEKTPSKAGSDRDSPKNNDHSDQDMRSEEENEEGKRLNSTPGPSSSRPHSEEEQQPPTTPNYLNSWPYVNHDSQSEDSNSLNERKVADDYLRAAYSQLSAHMNFLQPTRMPQDLLGVRAPLALPMLMTNKTPLMRPEHPREPPPQMSRGSRNSNYGGKNFPCERCGRSYASTGNLKRHLKYECGVDPQFCCPMCRKKFQHRHSVKIHVVSTHGKELRDQNFPTMTASDMEIIRMAKEEVSNPSSDVMPGPCSREGNVEDYYPVVAEASTGPSSSKDG